MGLQLKGHLFVLNRKGEPVEQLNWGRWAEWYDSAKINVALTHVRGVEVSTVFLGVNYNRPGGVPLVWETMVYRRRRNSRPVWSSRCGGDRKQAEEMHEAMVLRVQSAQELPPG